MSNTGRIRPLPICQILCDVDRNS